MHKAFGEAAALGEEGPCCAEGRLRVQLWLELLRLQAKGIITYYTIG